MAVFATYCSNSKNHAVDNAIFAKGQSSETVCSPVLFPRNMLKLHSEFILKLSQNSLNMSIRPLGCAEGEVFMISVHSDVATMNDLFEVFAYFQNCQ